MFKVSEKLRQDHDLPEGWQPYRLESLGNARTHVRLDGAVYPALLTRGPRKGRTDFKKPTPGTERVVIVSNAEYDEWMAEIRKSQAQPKT